MAPNDKQERRLMRQRGAGPRELKNAAFSFSFGAPALPPQPSTRKTPRGPTPTKTPLPARPSTRKTPAARASSAKSGTSSHQSINQGDLKTPTVSGKRKRASQSQPPETALESERDDLEVSNKDVESFKATPAGLPVSVGSKKMQTPAANLASDEDDLSPDQPIPDNFALPELRRTSIPILPLNPVERRPAPSPDRRPPREERGRSRTRKSVVSNYSLSTSRLSAVGEDEGEDADEESGVGANDTGTGLETTDATPSAMRNSETDASTAGRTTGTDTFDGGTSAFLRKHAAQSTGREVYEIPDDDASSDDELTPQIANKHSQRRQSDIDVIANTEDQEMEDQDELSPPQPATKQSRKRKSDIDILADAEDQDMEDEDELSQLQDEAEDSLFVRTPLADTTANTRREPIQQDKPRAKSPPQKRQKTSEPPTKKARTKGGPKVSITVYRRTKKPGTDDDDPLGIDPDPTPTLNAADVLSQITSEIINGYISDVPASSQRSTASQTKVSSKKTLRYQVQALQSFRDDLGDALRSITFAQLGVYKFSNEVRKAKKMKRELREELMGRRREREELEVRIDKIRAEHLAKQKDDEGRRELVDALEGIGEVVRKGREKTSGEEGVERGVLLETQDVVEGLGLLKRVREFNTFLEGAASALEGRV